MVQSKSPFVYWSQTETTVSLRVDIRNALNPEVDIQEDRIEFESSGSGADASLSNYHFLLELPHSVNPKASTFRVLDRDIDIILKKRTIGWWSKVCIGTRKPPWLKVDFDRWQSPEDKEEETPDIMREYPDLFDDLKKEETGYRIQNLRSVYLFLYNFFQFVGYLYIVGVLSVRYMREGPDATRKAYELVGFAIRYCQCLQLLEIIHPILKFTTGSPFVAAIQILGRGLVLFVVVGPEDRIQTHPGVFFLFYVWAIADCIRYPYYLLTISKVHVKVVTWIRYSAWILLIPIGVACEAILIFFCIPMYEESGRWSMSLPNSLNFTFNFVGIMRAYLLFGVFPLLYTLMHYMWRGRSKALNKKYKIK